MHFTRLFSLCFNQCIVGLLLPDNRLSNSIFLTVSSETFSTGLIEEPTQPPQQQT